ncbi:MAG: phosphoribosylaminoimidazolesuccinocarboxamide synthase [Bacillota bacterium]
MKKLGELYEGKAKKIFLTDDKDVVMVSYKDDATAFNGLKKGTIKDKGIVNNKMSNFMFKYLAEKGIPTHFIKEINDRETLVKKVEIIPVEVIVRNIAAGSMSKRLGVKEGTQLKTTVLEYSYKNDELADPIINDYHIYAMELATKEEMEKIAEMSLKINELMKEFFINIGIKLVDFKLEFGRYKGEVILADEISPDTCRFWDAKTNEKLDKDRFRRDLGGVEQAYQEMMKRIGL